MTKKEQIKELYIDALNNDEAPNVFADQILFLFGVVKSLPTKDEVSASVFNKVYKGELALRNVFRDEINDAYYSGALDMHEELTK